MTDPQWFKKAMSSEDYRRAREEARDNMRVAARALMTAIQSLEDLAGVTEQLGGQSGVALKKQAAELRKVLPVCKETLHMLR